jgi:hypothetical protein
VRKALFVFPLPAGVKTFALNNVAAKNAAYQRLNASMMPSGTACALNKQEQERDPSFSSHALSTSTSHDASDSDSDSDSEASIDNKREFPVTSPYSDQSVDPKVDERLSPVAHALLSLQSGFTETESPPSPAQPIAPSLSITAVVKAKRKYMRISERDNGIASSGSKFAEHKANKVKKANTKFGRSRKSTKNNQGADTDQVLSVNLSACFEEIAVSTRTLLLPAAHLTDITRCAHLPMIPFRHIGTLEYPISFLQNERLREEVETKWMMKEDLKRPSTQSVISPAYATFADLMCKI